MRLPRLVRIWGDSKSPHHDLLWWLGWMKKPYEVREVHRPEGATAWVKQPKRWVVERRVGWMGRDRRRSRDHEQTTGPSQAWIGVGAIGGMRRRLARLECGIAALDVLLRLEGGRPSRGESRDALPITNPAGHSMAELRDAAARFGLGLDGVQLERRDRAVDRPLIAFLKHRGKGHYVVLRPVGTTGTVVQVIDPPNAPWIGDFDRFAAGKASIGRVLVPRSAWPTRISMTLASGSVTVVTLVLVIRRRPRPGWLPGRPQPA